MEQQQNGREVSSETAARDVDPLPEPLVARLRKRLLAGSSSGEHLSEIATALALPRPAEDRTVAGALVRALSSTGRAALAIAKHVNVEAEGEGDAEVRPTADVEAEPALGLETRSAHVLWSAPDGGEAGEVRRFDDVRTLVAVMRGGTLRQRRTATLRLGELLRETRGLSSELQRFAVDTLIHMRKFDIAYELSSVCSQLPGAEGRRARAGRREWEQLVMQIESETRAFWDGELAREPISALRIDQQVQLLVRARDLPSEIAAHLGAVIEGTDGRATLAERESVISALLNAADPRLLPSLRGVLENGDAELVRPAARAIARIEDPRVQPALAQAYGQALRADQRLALAGALGMVGDMRGHDYVLQVLMQKDSPLLPRALQALDTLGTYEDEQFVLELLEGEDLEIVMAAVRTLARIGDGRALVPLARLRARMEHSALRAEIEDTNVAILARLDLMGEEPPAAEDAAEVFDTTKRAAIVKRRDPTWMQLRAYWSLMVGYVFILLGAYTKAVGRFEEAAALRRSWVTPVVAMAMTSSRRGNHAAALAYFRRALEIDREEVEQDPAAVRHAAQSFLRRAEAVESDGRIEIAYGLLEEALALDLRRAPSGLRFALNQRLEMLRARPV